MIPPTTESKRCVRGADFERPTQAEIDAMLAAANSDSIFHDLTPEPPSEMVWTCSAAAIGALLGLVCFSIVFGGWLGPLVGGVLGYVGGLGLAISLWQFSLLPTNLRSLPNSAFPVEDDLLDTW
jgi:hypothetical protein